MYDWGAYVGCLVFRTALRNIRDSYYGDFSYALREPNVDFSIYTHRDFIRLPPRTLNHTTGWVRLRAPQYGQPTTALN